MQGGERDAQLGGEPSQGVGVANESVVPVNYLLNHVQFIITVIGGGMVAPPTQAEGVL